MGEGQVRGGKSRRSGQRAAEPGRPGLEEYPVAILFENKNILGQDQCLTLGDS